MTNANMNAVLWNNNANGARVMGAITLSQQGKDNFTVTYHLQVKKRLTYAQAASELGECLMHLAACEGELDNG